jgi:hypothetical protein
MARKTRRSHVGALPDRNAMAVPGAEPRHQAGRPPRNLSRPRGRGKLMLLTEGGPTPHRSGGVLPAISNTLRGNASGAPRITGITSTPGESAGSGATFSMVATGDEHRPPASKAPGKGGKGTSGKPDRQSRSPRHRQPSQRHLKEQRGTDRPARPPSIRVVRAVREQALEDKDSLLREFSRWWGTCTLHKFLCKGESQRPSRDVERGLTYWWGLKEWRVRVRRTPSHCSQAPGRCRILLLRHSIVQTTRGIRLPRIAKLIVRVGTILSKRTSVQATRRYLQP